MISKSRSKKTHKKKLLSNSRPGVPSNKGSAPSTLSSRHTRSIISSHHTLSKRLHQAEAARDERLAASLRNQLSAAGGLPAYQAASIQGQAADRGGDTSKVLVEWMKEAGLSALVSTGSGSSLPSSNGLEDSLLKLRLLEVGALRSDNACSRSGMFDVERIDLHSQHRLIKEQNFMERPVPRDEVERDSQGFDVVSLSLVINYVGDAEERGRMLERVGAFLRATTRVCGKVDKRKVSAKWFPGVFLVLPAPCVLNSRYMDEERLEEVMASLGFEVVRRKNSKKLVYHYYKYHYEASGQRGVRFGKIELRKGGKRNNFAIIL